MKLAGNDTNYFTGRESHWQHLHDDREYVIRLARDTFLVNLCSVAALAWIVYDFILCFGDEVSLVWNRWHLQKGRHTRRIYALVRYLSIVNLGWFVAVNTSSDLSLDFCNAWYYIVVINTTAITLLPDVIILIRINAVYAWNSTTSIFTASLFCIQLISSLAIGFLTISTAQISAPAGPSLPGCSISSFSLTPIVTLAAWTPSIVAQSSYFFLMVMSLLSVMRDLDPDGKPTREGLAQVRELIPTMVVFMKHGILYFTIAIVTKIMNATIVISTSGPLQAIGIPWMMAIYPILISHIYLDMVEYLRAHRRPIPHIRRGASDDGVRLSYSSMEPAPRIDRDLGQITFAAPQSRFSGASLLDIMDDEF